MFTATLSANFVLTIVYVWGAGRFHVAVFTHFKGEIRERTVALAVFTKTGPVKQQAFDRHKKNVPCHAPKEKPTTQAKMEMIETGLTHT